MPDFGRALYSARGIAKDSLFMTQQAAKENIEIPSLHESISRRLKDFSSLFNCMTLGTIESFDETDHTAVISVNFLRTLKGGSPIVSPDTNKAADKLIEYPLLVRCPVVFMFGGRSYLTFPITKGDTCLVIFCDRDIDIWFKTGQVVAPNTERLHDLNDGIALVGIRSLRNSLSSYNTTGPELASASALVAV